MGDRISAHAVRGNVKGLNQMFSGTNLQDLRDDVAYLRKGRYPKLLNAKPGAGDKRQASLWFAASVLTPHFDLPDYPANTHRRWIMWLKYLQDQPHKTTAHDDIKAAINNALDDRNQTQIIWTWTEDKAPMNVGAKIDYNTPTAGVTTIAVTSLTANYSEVEKHGGETN